MDGNEPERVGASVWLLVGGIVAVVVIALLVVGVLGLTG